VLRRSSRVRYRATGSRAAPGPLRCSSRSASARDRRNTWRPATSSAQSRTTCPCRSPNQTKRRRAARPTAALRRSARSGREPAGKHGQWGELLDRWVAESRQPPSYGRHVASLVGRYCELGHQLDASVSLGGGAQQVLEGEHGRPVCLIPVSGPQMQRSDDIGLGSPSRNSRKSAW
jgi:hypothetical protein